MSSASSPSKSPLLRATLSLSCVSKRPDSSAFESAPPGSEPYNVIKRPTASNSLLAMNRRGSESTLNDASSLVDHSATLLSPAKRGATLPKTGSFANNNTTTTTSCGSQVDLASGGDSLVTNKLATLVITQRESMYVRALFQYDPDTDRGLAARVSAYIFNVSIFPQVWPYLNALITCSHYELTFSMPLFIECLWDCCILFGSIDFRGSFILT